MINYYFRNRRRTREVLLSAFYANEINESGFGFILNNIEDFINVLYEAKIEDIAGFLRERFYYIFNDVKNKRYLPEDLVLLTLPNTPIEIEITMGELDLANKKDKFYELCQRYEKQGKLEIDIERTKNKIQDCEFVPAVDNNVLFMEQCIKMYKENLSEVDDLIKEYTKNWDYSRISIIDKIIIRMGIIEFKYFEDIPPKVTINEAIELSKKYSSEKSKIFINGLLHSLKDNCK